MNTRLARRSLLALTLVTGAHLTLAAPGCTGTAGTTTGKRITLGTGISAAESPTAPFTNGKGWTITLDRALVSVGSLAYFDGEPFTAALEPTRRRRPASPELEPNDRSPLRELFGPRLAHAHPGHYVPGNALGQVTRGDTVDLLALETTLASTEEAVTGTYRSATFGFGEPPAGALAAGLEGGVALVSGTATSGDTTLLFRARALASEVLDTETPATPSVHGCIFDEALVEKGGHVEVRVSLHVWLDQVDFADATPPASPGERVTLDGAAHEAFTRGLVKGSAYLFRYVPPLIE
jgi:hypothetical protein